MGDLHRPTLTLALSLHWREREHAPHRETHFRARNYFRIKVSWLAGLACYRRVWTPTALSHRGNVGGVDFDGGGLTDEVNRDDQAVGFLLSDENPMRALEGPASHLYRHSDV